MNLRRSPARHDGSAVLGDPALTVPAPRHPWAVELTTLAEDPAGLPSRRALASELADAELSDEERTALGWVLAAIADERPHLRLSRATAHAVHRYAGSPELDRYLLGRTARCAAHARAAQQARSAAGLGAPSQPTRTGTGAAAERTDRADRCARRLGEDSHDLSSTDGLKALVRDLVTATIVVPHLWPASAYLVARTLRDRRGLTVLGSLVDQVVHDEALNVTFGLTLVLTIIAEHEALQGSCFAEDVTALLVDAAELESRYVHERWPGGTLGLEPARLAAYVEHLTDRRLADLGLPPQLHPPVAAAWV